MRYSIMYKVLYIDRQSISVACYRQIQFGVIYRIYMCSIALYMIIQVHVTVELFCEMCDHGET